MSGTSYRRQLRQAAASRAAHVSDVRARARRLAAEAVASRVATPPREVEVSHRDLLRVLAWVADGTGAEPPNLLLQVCLQNGLVHRERVGVGGMGSRLALTPAGMHARTMLIALVSE